MYQKITLVLVSYFCLAAAGPASSDVIIRPCPDFDVSCIRAYFAANSSCNPNVAGAIGTNPDFPDYNQEIPSFNESRAAKNITLGNADSAYVEDFYTDTETDVVVLTVVFPDFVYEADTQVTLHRRGYENLQVESHYVETYPEVAITTIIPGVTNLNFHKSTSYANIPQALNLDVGDGVREAAAESAVVAAVLETVESTPSLLGPYGLEAFLVRSPVVARIYVNSIICRF